MKLYTVSMGHPNIGHFGDPFTPCRIGAALCLVSVVADDTWSASLLALGAARRLWTEVPADQWRVRGVREDRDINAVQGLESFDEAIDAMFDDPAVRVPVR